MNGYKIKLVILSGLIGLAIVLYLYSVEEHECINNCHGDSVTVGSKTPSKPVPMVSKARNTDIDLPKERNSKELTSGNASDSTEKSFNQGWCKANSELADNDLMLAEDQIRDWEEYIGLALIKSSSSIQQGDRNFPNNFNVAPYQELPIAELTSLAVNGDKWAMVTFVQTFSLKQELKKDIAKDLIVLGASYHGIEYLVIQSLAVAKSKLRRKIDDFSKEVANQREILGITPMAIPKAGIKQFEGDLASIELRYNDQVENLRSIEVKENNNLRRTSCVDTVSKHLSKIKSS